MKPQPKKAVPGRKARPAGDDDKEKSPDYQVLAGLLRAHGSGMTVKLRVFYAGPPQRWDHLTTMPLSADIVEDVQAKYGGGLYRALVHNAERQYIRGGTLEFSIAGRAKPIEDDGTRPPDDRLARLEKVVEKLLTPAPVDPVKQFSEMAGVIGNMYQSVPQSGGAGLDILTLLELLDRREDRAESRAEKIAEIKAEKNDPMHKYFPPVLSMLQETLKQKREQRGQLPATPPPPTPVIQQEWLGDQAYEWVVGLRPFYDLIGAQAASGVTPTLVADMCIENITSETWTAIEASERRDDFAEVFRTELAAINADYSDWLEQFIARFREVARK